MLPAMSTTSTALFIVSRIDSAAYSGVTSTSWKRQIAVAATTVNANMAMCPTGPIPSVGM